MIWLGIAPGLVSGDRQGERGKVLYKEKENQMRKAESGVERIWVQEREGQIIVGRAVRSQGLS